MRIPRIFLASLTLVVAPDMQSIHAAQNAIAPSDEPVMCAASDWARISLYRNANAALEPQPHRVVFLGDSITEEWANENLMRTPGFVNRGIGGQTTPQMLVRFASDVLALKPAIVHIMGGTNDVAGNTGPETDQEIESYWAEMAQLARIHGIKVVLASIPPTVGYPWRPSVSDASGRIRRLNMWLKAYAAQNKFVFVDYWSVLSTPGGAMRPEFTMDGVHPNHNGYAVMQAVALAALSQAERISE